MKRMTYVDNMGNAVNRSLENRKPLLRFLLAFSTLVPLALIILIIITIFQNKNCNSVYKAIETAAKSYINEVGPVPEVEGDNTTISIGDLYSEQYLKSSSTNETLCSGTVKITKYKDDFIYTLDVKKCNKCSTNERYSGWSNPQNNYPRGKSIVDVIPYYNYYERQTNTTPWSKYYEEDELSDETSEYGIKLPLDLESLPEIPEEANVMDIEEGTTYYYRYSDKSWKWYDIVGNYSKFSSEQPQGFANKDEQTEKFSDWSEYSLDYPEEKSYRTIENTTGYKFYYLNDKNEKIYANNGNYTPREKINTEKYDQAEAQTSKLYRYRDKMWRWYNGQKRNYSYNSSTMPAGRPYKDEETEIIGNPSSWSEERKANDSNSEYRLEEKKLMTRFRKKYEILSLKVLNEPLNKEEFESKVKENLTSFSTREDRKLETTYKFVYRV